MEAFAAVAATQTYCHPGCPIRPRPRCTQSFPSAAAAEAAGYRPCLRCRPYRVPPTLDRAGSDLVWRGIQLIRAGCDGGAAGDDDRAGDRIAARLGVAPDHLRRGFLEETGATADQVARSHRAHFARRLLDETDLPVGEVARASGYRDRRDLAGACDDVFGVTPEGLRTRRWALDRLVADAGIALRLPFRGELDWEAMLAQLGERPIPGVERIADGVYRRTVVVGDEVTVLEVAPRGTDHLVLRIALPRWDGLIRLVERARRLFALDSEPGYGADRAGDDTVPGGLAGERPGARVPGAWDPVEAGVRAIVGQQATAAGALAIASRLVARHGTRVPGLGCPGLTHAFPSAETLACADLADLGLTRPRADTIRSFARAVVDDRIRLDRSVGLGPLVASLSAIPGIDRSVAYDIAVRTGERDVPVPAPESAEDSGWPPRRAVTALRRWVVGRETTGARRTPVASLPPHGTPAPA
ncbi:MAG TPA: AlkA N-terminal domain-containing protein [Acidimicrobiales bacterium]